MGVRERSPIDVDIDYTRPRFGSPESEQAWKDACEAAKKRQTSKWAVAVGCTITTTRDTTLTERQEVVPSDVGGMGNLSKLVSIGVVLEITERQARTNAGDFEFRTLKAIVDGATKQVFDKDVGFNADELDVPAEEPYQALDVQSGRVVSRPGRPERPGAERVEQWIKDGLAERARLRDAVIATAQKALKSSGSKSSK